MPRKRFVKCDAQNGKDYKPGQYVLEGDEKNRKRYVKGEHDFKDQLRERIELYKTQHYLHLRSKFLNKFTTLMGLGKKGENYQSVEGFEKILAAQMLLGEGDIRQPENFGLIEKKYKNAKGEKVKEKLWAKIDHGRSLYFRVDHWSDISLRDFETFGIKVDHKRLVLELSTYVSIISENEELTDRLIDKKASNLNQFLNPKMKFSLHEEVFSYSAESKEFMSDKGNSLGGHFKQRLKSQIQVIGEYSKVLHVMAAIKDNTESINTNLLALFNSQIKDPIIWAVNNGKSINGKDPILWAIDNGKSINGKDPILWAIDNGKKIDGKDPILWVSERGEKIDGKDPILWAIDNGKKIEGKKPGKCAAEHNLLINGKNPETFASKVQLVKFVNKASLPTAGLAFVACTGFIIANLNTALIIAAAAVALITALIVKPIALYVQKDLLQNSIVSTSFNDPSVREYQREPKLC